MAAMRLAPRVLLCLSAAVAAQSVNITGTVTHAISGIPLEGVRVILTNLPSLSDTTGDSGTYLLYSDIVRNVGTTSRAPAKFSSRLNGSTVEFALPQSGDVLVELFSVSGARQATLYRSRQAQPGAYRVPLSSAARAPGLYVVRVQAGPKVATHSYLAMARRQAGSGVAPQAAALVKSLAGAVDTLVFSLPGFSTARVPVDAYIGRYDAQLTPLEPDSIVCPVTYFDFHNDGSCPEFGCYLWLWGGGGGCTNDTTLARKLGPDGLPRLGPANGCNRTWGADRLWKAWPQYAVGDVRNQQRPFYNYNGSLRHIDTLPVGADTAYKNVKLDTSLVLYNTGGGMYRFTDLFFMPLAGRGFNKAPGDDHPDCQVHDGNYYGAPPGWAYLPFNSDSQDVWCNLNTHTGTAFAWFGTWTCCTGNGGCAPTDIYAGDCDANPVPGLTTDSTNFCFTAMLRTRFVFEPGLKFKFAGEDDMWVYVDSTLVMDNKNGGEWCDSIDLDSLASMGVNLTVDSSYDFVFLYIERMPPGASVLIETNIKF